MGVFSNLRGSRAQEALPVSEGPSPTSASSSAPPSKSKWRNLMPLAVVLVVLAEITFLGRLDMAKDAGVLENWPEIFIRTPPSYEVTVDDSWVKETVSDNRQSSEESCEVWLEREDALVYSRDFDKDPILVNGADQERKNCAVGCKFGFNHTRKADAAIGASQESGTAAVLRSMESTQQYAENTIDQASRRGYDVVMTTRLSSDVPVGYFSWAEYDIMAPVQPKTESALAAVFISNCGALNFRLQALIDLEKASIKIDSYGSCHRNRDGNVDKVEALKHYKFSLAFENSIQEDYVTEKFFQSLVAGSVPVVIGAPTIDDFAPALGSLLHIKEVVDVPLIAKEMKYLSDNPDAYNQTLRWKYEGPSDSFKALVDMAAVHSSCRLCIHLATGIREKEEKKSNLRKRPCKCTRGSDTLHHIYVRERGRFKMDSVFLRSENLTLAALESAVLTKFKSLKHVPIWKTERPESLRGGDELKVYRIHPVGLTQRQALYSFRFSGDEDFREHIESNPCAKFEVIFV